MGSTQPSPASDSAVRPVTTPMPVFNLRKKTDSESDPDVIMKRFDTEGVNQMFPDDANDKRHFEAMNIKGTSKFYDPCKLSAQMSLSCLDRNRYNEKRAKENCKEFFEAYKECKTEWRASRRSLQNEL
ncbi:uncharacterized protein V2V93DRAFT_376095 [Kockiozyma suomiensis]|uniref:uncharacterized protein n=1 Tax=Kockiozyma suomiensis TaxID=1337062 RepID=UPI0033435574